MAIPFSPGGNAPRGPQTAEMSLIKINQILFDEFGGGSGGATAPGGSNFAIPPFDQEVFAYVNGGAADDDDIQTITYKKDGVVVATLTFTYYLNTNNVQSIIQT